MLFSSKSGIILLHSRNINKIDFNSKELQVYAPNLGMDSLRKSIVNHYFKSSTDNLNFLSRISITPGGMPALDLVIQLLNVENIESDLHSPLEGA